LRQFKLLTVNLFKILIAYTKPSAKFLHYTRVAVHSSYVCC